MIHQGYAALLISSSTTSGYSSIDRHGDDPDETAEINDVYGRHLHDRLRDLGFRPLLLDSNGRGGRHLTVLFEGPVPAREARSLGLWLVGEWEESGLTKQPEVFPKQDSILKGELVGYGNFVRLFGKHHKRDHFTKVWDGSNWLAGEVAVQAILRASGEPISLAPSEALCFRTSGHARPGKAQWWKAYEGDLRSLDIEGLFRARGLWATVRDQEQFVVQCPWSEQHTSGGDAAYVKAADKDRGLFATFYCHHSHCEDRGIQDMLGYFGKPAVERFCRKSFGPTGEERGQGGYRQLIEPTDPMETARNFHADRGEDLVHHLDRWQRWDGRKYVLVTDSDVRAWTWTWLEACRQDSRGTMIPIRPKATMVTALLDALKAVCNVSSSLEMPHWLEQGSHPCASDIVAFDNGLLDLRKFATTGETNLIPHSRRWFSNICLPHEYDPSARSPEWEKFLDDVFERDEERIRALAQWFGYCMTNDTKQHRFALLIGPPRSGKGTVLRVLTELLGDANVATPSLTSLGSRFGMAPLVGKLAALVGDGHLGRQSDAVAILERLKSISGGDPQNVDRKNAAELSNVAITARFTIAVNELPRLPDASAALRSRMLVFPFNQSFEGKEDFDLGLRLSKEIAGITNWALDGLRELRNSKRLLQPLAGKDILDDFVRLSSPVRTFLEDRCQIGPGHWVRGDVLRTAWVKWCEERGLHPLGDSAFGAKLRAVHPQIKRTRRREGGRQQYTYDGIGLN